MCHVRHACLRHVTQQRKGRLSQLTRRVSAHRHQQLGRARRLNQWLGASPQPLDHAAYQVQRRHCKVLRLVSCVAATFSQRGMLLCNARRAREGGLRHRPEAVAQSARHTPQALEQRQ